MFQKSVLLYKPPIRFLHIMNSYNNKIADSESKLNMHSTALNSKIFVFLRIRMTIIIGNPQIPSKALITLKNIKKKFDQGVHNDYVLVDQVAFSRW